MKKIVYPLFALAVVGFFGCEGDSDTTTQTSELTQKSCVPDDLPQPECDSLKALLSDTTNRISDVSLLSKHDNLGTGAVVGDKNIYVEFDQNDELMLYVITKTQGGISGANAGDEVVNLSTHAARIKILKSGEFNIEKFAKGKVFELSRKLQWDINENFGMKIVPDYMGTKYPALIGMDDAREFSGNYANKRGFEVLIDHIPFPNEKKVHVYLDGSTLRVSGTGSTKMQTSTNNVDKRRVGDVCWGKFVQCCSNGSCPVIP